MALTIHRIVSGNRYTELTLAKDVDYLIVNAEKITSTQLNNNRPIKSTIREEKSIGNDDGNVDAFVTCCAQF